MNKQMEAKLFVSRNLTINDKAMELALREILFANDTIIDWEKAEKIFKKNMPELKGSMNKEQILETIKKLAKSQGIYSRIYANLMNMEKDARNKVLQQLEDENFKDAVDLCLYFES